MGIILIFILTVGCLYSDDYYFNNKTYLTVDKGFGSINTPKETKKKTSLSKIVLRNNFLAIKDDNKFAATINYTSVVGMGFNNKYKTRIGGFDILNIENLYYTKCFKYGISATIGIINFRTNNFNTSNIYNSINGIGIYGLVDFELEGLLLSYRTETAMFTAGFISKDKYFNTAHILNTNNNVARSKKIFSIFNGSDGHTLLIKHKPTSRLTLDYNFYHYNELLYGLGEKEIKLIALSIIYDRTTTIGDKLYSVISLSNTDGDSSSLKQIYPNEIVSNSYFGEYDVDGYNIMLGYSKHVDELMPKHSVKLGIEIEYVSENYNNLSIGMPISVNSNGAIGYTVRGYSTVTIKRDMLIRIMYDRYLNGTGKTTQVLGVPIATIIDEKSTCYKNSSLFSMGFIYKF